MAYPLEELELLFGEMDEKSQKTVDSFKTELQAIRAGRANPHILDKVLVDYYGVPTPINNMANVTIAEARVLVISVWDKSALKNVEKAILAANVGITPNNDGNVIRLVFPALTEERRKELVKQVKRMTEDAKIAVRNIRRDTLDTLKKLKNGKEITEDELASFSDTVEKAVTSAIDKIDALSSEKEKDVMTV